MKFTEMTKQRIRSFINMFDVWKFNINKNIEIGRHTWVRMARIEEHVRIGDYCNIQRGG